MTKKSRLICLALALIKMLTALFECVRALADVLSKAVNYAGCVQELRILV